MDTVCAVIKREDTINKEQDDLYFIVRLANNVSLPSLWGFVRGKVKKGERHSDAKKRQVIEEMGKEIDIIGLQHPINHS